MDFNQWCAANGFDPEALTDQQRATLQAQWRASQKPADPKPDPEPDPKRPAATESLDDILAATRRENERREAITGLVAKYLADNPGQLATLEPIGRLAIEGKWDVQRADLELLRASRGAGPHVYATSQPDLTNEVVEAAVCRAGGLDDEALAKDYGDRTMTAVDRRFRRGIGLQQVLGLCARQNGFRGDVRSDLRDALMAAFHGPAAGGLMAVGPSTLAISGILSNTAQKFLRDAFMAVDTAWRRVGAIGSVSDFKTVTSYSLTGDLQYEKVAPGGELKHGTLGNETYTNRADTYGKLLAIDRRDWKNDDLGAFTKAAKRLGRGGALKVNDVFWAEFMADASTFWTAGRGNYDDGTDTAFGADGLTAADVIWQAKTDPDGKPLGVAAKILLTPPAHRIPAKRLMNSQQVMKDSDLGSDNPHAGMYEPVCTPYLANSSYTGYSALAWYLLADPNELPVIEIVFLDGMEMPTIETAEMEAGRLGVVLQAYHDFGVEKQEYRGGLKLKGEA